MTKALWFPRILSLLFAGFLALFALDTFDEGLSFWKTIVALTMHLVPAGLVLIVTAIAWKREVLGAILFMGLAVAYVCMTWGRFPIATYVIIAGPPVLIAASLLICRRSTNQDSLEPAVQ